MRLGCFKISGIMLAKLTNGAFKFSPDEVIHSSRQICARMCAKVVTLETEHNIVVCSYSLIEYITALLKVYHSSY